MRSKDGLKQAGEADVSTTMAGNQNNWRRRVDFLTGFVAAFSLVTLFARWWWVADLIANLRVQLILGLLAVMVCLTLMRRWPHLALITVLTLWQLMALGSAVLTSDSGREQSVDGKDSIVNEASPRLRVFLANVLTRNQRHDLIVEQIRTADPDVIAILELSSQLHAKLQQEFGETYKHVVFETQDDGNFGIGLWSRLPLKDARIFHLNDQYLPSIEADLQLGSREVHLVATHPLPPVDARNFAHRNFHLALLAKRLNSDGPGTAQIPTLVLGDLNLTPWSPLFDDFLASSGLRNSAAGQGLQPTWYRWSWFPFGLVLDHGLHSDHIRCDQRTILPANGSDHRALVFDFVLNPLR